MAKAGHTDMKTRRQYPPPEEAETLERRLLQPGLGRYNSATGPEPEAASLVRLVWRRSWKGRT